MEAKELPLRTGPHYLFNYVGAWDTSPGPSVLAPEESTQPPPWGLMADGIVGWHSFDAESGLVPEELSPSILPGGGEGRVVALAATPFAQAEGWASQAAVAVARSWAQESLRIFLMDLGLDAPSLHKALGLRNQEGVSDAFMYGASVQRIAQPALDDAIFFASAGTATSDPAQILGHPRWNDLASGFSEADATLLLFLPTDIAGADKILSRATEVVFLAGRGETPETHLGPAAIKVVAMMGPAGAPPEAKEAALASGGAQEGPEETAGIEMDAAFESAKGLLGEVEPPGAGPEGPLDGGLVLAEGFISEGGTKDLSPGEPLPETSFGEGLAGGLTLDREFGLGPEGLEWEAPGVGGDGSPEDPSPIGGEFGGQGIPTQEIPDFQADFIELPGIEGVAHGAGGGAESGEEIERGSAFAQDYVPGPARGEEEFDSHPPDSQEDAARPDRSLRPPGFPDRPRPVAKLRPPPKKRFTAPVIAGAAAVLVALIAAGGTAVGVFSVPGFRWLEDLFGEVPLPELTVAGPQPTNPVLRFSLELDVYDAEELGLALEMRNTLRQRLPSLTFNLTPAESEGTVTYALHAGPAIDVVEAENLRAPLSQVLTREDPDSWLIRETPRAFLLGEAETLTEARGALAEAEALGVFGYILRVNYPDGSERYEVLSGAFQNVEDARGWQLTLRDHGFRDVPLIERRGLPPE